MNEKIYTIDDLYSDSGPFNEAEVIEALHPLVTIQKTTNSIFFKKDSLSAVQKILAYALAIKLLKHKGVISSELITAQEVFERTGLKRGTVDPTFKYLREKGFFVGKKEYEIPYHKVGEVIKVLNNKNKI